jgi:hypothetical protein
MGGQSETYSKRHRLIVGLLVLSITLAGVVAYTNWFSFLMLLLLGVPGLLVVIDVLLDE